MAACLPREEEVCTLVPGELTTSVGWCLCLWQGRQGHKDPTGEEQERAKWKRQEGTREAGQAWEGEAACV